jgi:hypothetical protein
LSEQPLPRVPVGIHLSVQLAAHIRRRRRCRLHRQLNLGFLARPTALSLLVHLLHLLELLLRQRGFIVSQ